MKVAILTGGGDCPPLESAFITGNRQMYDVEYENVSGGRWWVSWGNPVTSTYEIRAYDSTPARLASEDFSTPVWSRGISYGNSAFWTMPRGQEKFRKHSGWTSSSDYVHVKYAWYDTGGDDETKPSAQSYLAYIQRSKLRVTWPAIPSGANRARVYLLENSGTGNPSAGAMYRQSEESGTSVTYSSYDSNGNPDGAQDATSNGFPAATPSTFVLPKKYSAPGSPVAGQMYYDTGTNKAYVYDGSSWNALW